MLFIALMSLTTTAVASIAAFFSVYGLAHTFTGAFWSVVAMGSALEAGKLMLASFVYRFREVIDWKVKLPAYAFILSLMIVTSTGIYGYLSAAYQSDSVGMKEVAGTLELKKSEQETLQKRKAEIDQQVSQLPANDVRGRQRLIRQFDSESKQINTRLSEVTKEIQELSQKQIQAEAHIGPIMYLAKIIGTDADNAIGLLMLLIIFAFDPLAMLLTIATNIAIERHKAKKDEPTPVVEKNYKDSGTTYIVPTSGHDDIAEAFEEHTKYVPSNGEAVHEEAEAKLKEIQEVKNVPDLELVPISVEDSASTSIEKEPVVFSINFNDHDPEEVIPEAEIQELNPIEEIKQIETELEQKVEKTKEEQEMEEMIKKFFARQELIRSTRR